MARHFFTVLARIPSTRMSRAMRCSPTQCPRLIRASQILGLPWLSRVSQWMTRMAESRMRLCAVRSLSGGPTQA